MMDGMSSADLKDLKTPSWTGITLNAMAHSDAVIQGSELISPTLSPALKKLGKPMLGFKNSEEYIDAYNSFYDELMVEDGVLAG